MKKSIVYILGILLISTGCPSMFIYRGKIVYFAKNTSYEIENFKSSGLIKFTQETEEDFLFELNSHCKLKCKSLNSSINLKINPRCILDFGEPGRSRDLLMKNFYLELTTITTWGRRDIGEVRYDDSIEFSFNGASSDSHHAEDFEYRFTGERTYREIETENSTDCHDKEPYHPPEYPGAGIRNHAYMPVPKKSFTDTRFTDLEQSRQQPQQVQAISLHEILFGPRAIIRQSIAESNYSWNPIALEGEDELRKSNEGEPGQLISYEVCTKVPISALPPNRAIKEKLICENY